MQDIARRSFVKTAFAGAAVAALGTSLARSAFAAEIADVKFAKDPKNPQPGLETAHTPSIALEKVDSKGVAFGKTPAGDFYKVSVQAKHESTKEHHVFGIALYLNGELIAQHAMTQAQVELSLPAVTSVQRLKIGDELVAVTNCNLHGKWGNRISV